MRLCTILNVPLDASHLCPNLRRLPTCINDDMGVHHLLLDDTMHLLSKSFLAGA